MLKYASHRRSRRLFLLALALTLGVCPIAAQTASGPFADLGRYLRTGGTACVTDRESRESPCQVRAPSPISSVRAVESQEQEIRSTRGGRVRITVDSIVEPPEPGHQFVGTILRATDQTVVVVRDDKSIITVPRAAIVRLERSVGPRSRKFPVVVGLLAGAGAGAGTGYVIGSRVKCAGLFAPPGSPEIYPCLLAYDRLYTVIGAMVGAGAGALIGTLVPLNERWVPSPVESLPGK